jgi:tetratricopeptide (TPR) repeat protein
LAKADYDAAFNSFNEALQLRSKYLAKIDPNHPDIGVSHHNLGKISSKIAQNAEAQRHYSQAAEIYRHNYPQTHPLVIEITKYLRTK